MVPHLLLAPALPDRTPIRVADELLGGLARPGAPWSRPAPPTPATG
jgi:hypothetical protein